MYGEDHYLSKIERNSYVVDHAPAELKDSIIKNILWCRNMASKLSGLDYEQREKVIAQMHLILDNDYKAMGYTLEKEEEKPIIK